VSRPFAPPGRDVDESVVAKKDFFVDDGEKDKDFITPEPSSDRATPSPPMAFTVVGLVLTVLVWLYFAFLWAHPEDHFSESGGTEVSSARLLLRLGAVGAGILLARSAFVSRRVWLASGRDPMNHRTRNRAVAICVVSLAGFLSDLVLVAIAGSAG
jgi:hypothetical protein